MNNTFKQLPIDKIADPERPLRTNLTPESVDELVFSIKEVGIIQPLTVCTTDTGYEVIAGHRRLMAAEIAGLVEVPCIVVEAGGMDKELLKMHENVAREDINPIDWANHLSYLKQQYNLTIAKLAEVTGFSEAWVSQHLEILNYPEEVLIAIRSGQMSFSSARELAQIKDPAKRKIYVHHAVKGGVTPSMAANWRRQANIGAPAPQVNSEGEIDNIALVGADIPDPICPVCNLPVPMAEQKSLIIHFSCQPK